MKALCITDDPGRVFRSSMALRPLGIETYGVNNPAEWKLSTASSSIPILSFDPLFGCIASIRPDIIFVANGKADGMNALQVITAIRDNPATCDIAVIHLWSGLSLLTSTHSAPVETIVEPMTLISARTALITVLPEHDWIIDSS